MACTPATRYVTGTPRPRRRSNLQTASHTALNVSTEGHGRLSTDLNNAFAIDNAAIRRSSVCNRTYSYRSCSFCINNVVRRFPACFRGNQIDLDKTWQTMAGHERLTVKIVGGITPVASPSDIFGRLLYTVHRFDHSPVSIFHHTQKESVNQCAHKSYQSRILKLFVKGRFSKKQPKRDLGVPSVYGQEICFWTIRFILSGRVYAL